MFPLTLVELKERLKGVDEVTLLERLNKNSEDLVNVFADDIEENPEVFLDLVDWEEEE
jgi:hypothetical protein